jgi:transcriptional regulator with GAF, ATPase, and Fis domain
VVTVPALSAVAPRRRLLVFGDGTFTTYPLPDTGQVVIGRSEKCDIRIDHPSISRRHAILHIGPPLRIEELGSSNGTRVRDVEVLQGQGVEVFPGDVIDLGSTMMTVQAGSSVSRPRRLWTHSYFEARLEEECARAERSGGRFAVVRLHIDGNFSSKIAEEVLAAELRSIDLVAAYGPSEYELMLLDSAPIEADETTHRLVLHLEGRGATVRIGTAYYPKDGRGPEALVARACAFVRGKPTVEASAPPVVVQDGAMQRLHRLVERIAAGTISVILLGETGVGKEVLAEQIHRRSPRAHNPFVRLNCAALSESLLESELFGHERGAFTGAVQTKPGLLETAQGGTVFLDEVGELPPSIQVKLLRVLEERRILRVGGVKPRSIDVRFIAATNRDLEGEVQRGTFRSDLYFRLSGVSLVIPPLRERVSEIEGLAKAFVLDACRQAGRFPEPELSPEALMLLKSYSWPGNIRELRNVIERAVLLCPDASIRLDHLPIEKMGATLLGPSRRPTVPPPAIVSSHLAHDALSAPLPLHGSPDPATVPFEPRRATPPENPASSTSVLLKSEMEALERRRIVQALEQCGGNQSQAAKLLGMPRRTLVTRLDAYGIARPRKRAAR